MLQVWKRYSARGEREALVYSKVDEHGDPLGPHVIVDKRTIEVSEWGDGVSIETENELRDMIRYMLRAAVQRRRLAAGLAPLDDDNLEMYHAMRALIAEL